MTRFPTTPFKNSVGDPEAGGGGGGGGDYLHTRTIYSDIRRNLDLWKIDAIHSAISCTADQET